MVHLRLARKSGRDETPLHFEGLELVSWAKYAGWIGGTVAAAAGVTLMVTLAGSGADILGASLASLGAITLAAALRCRRFETTVGKRWLRWRCGPFHGDVPTNLICGGSDRAATRWRSLYSEVEVVIDLGTGQAGPILPTADPVELMRLSSRSPGRPPSNPHHRD